MYVVIKMAINGFCIVLYCIDNNSHKDTQVI